jgi:membrane protein
VSGAEIGYVPARDVDAIRTSDLSDALRRDPLADDVRAGVERRLGPELLGLVRALEGERLESEHNLTLRELAELARDDAPAGPRPAAAANGNGDGHGNGNGKGEEVLDPKQPEVPS